MRVICCKCEKWLQDVPGPEATSHGLCERCAERMLLELGVNEGGTPRPQARHAQARHPQVTHPQKALAKIARGATFRRSA